MPKPKHIYILCLLLLGVFAGRLQATHLVGGFISYEYVGSSASGTRYTITITSYRDCKPGSIEFSKDIDVCVYNRSDLKLQGTYNFLRKSIEKVQPVGRTDCPEATSVCLEKAIFQRQIDLPKSSFGYIVKWEICCRNEQVNLRNDQDGNPFIGQTYQTIIPPTNVRNSSPVFTDVPVPFICVNDTNELNNYAVDPDGDSLVYRLATPWYGASLANNYPGCEPVYSAPEPIRSSDYNLGYNGSIPFGATGISLINSRNGVSTFLARKTGNYAVAIDLLEYRNGVLMSSTRLDLQILVINCTPNNKPTVSSSSRNYTIMAGDQLCFDVTANDKDNHNITLSGIGDLLTGANGFTGNRATFASAFGRGSVKSTFCWQTSCSQASTTPYLFTVKAVDDGCPSKFTLVNIQITVLPFTGKVSLTGPAIACQGSKGIVYNINNTAATPDELNGLTHVVSVVNGTLLSQTTGRLQINWDNGASSGEINIQPFSRFGCPGEPFKMQVTLAPAPAKPVLPASDTVCENTSRTYSIPPSAGHTYRWWVNNGSMLGSGTSNTADIVWGIPGKAYARMVQYSANGCPSDTALIDVWISKPQTPPISGKQSVCPNSAGLVYRVEETGFGSDFMWFVSGGSIMGSNRGSSVSVSWGGPGSGLVRVIEINRFGCQGDTMSLPVLKTYDMQAEMIQGDTDVCAFTAAQVFSVPSSPGTVYNWTVSGGTLISGQGSSRIVVDWGAVGTGSVSMYESSYDTINQRNCISNLVSRTVHIRPYPLQGKISGDFEVCQDSKGIHTFTYTGYPNSFFKWWINGDSAGGFVQGNTVLNMPLSLDGSFLIRVVERTEFGCEGNPVDSLLVIHPRPQTGPVSGDSIICAPDLQNHTYTTTGFGTSSFYWFVDGGVKTNPGNGPTAVVNWSGQQLNRIRVLEISGFGCPGDTVSLDVFYDQPSLYLNYITVSPPPATDNALESFWTLQNAPRYNNQLLIEKRVAGSAQPFVTAGTVSGSTVSFSDNNTMNDSNAWEYRIKGFDLCGKPLYSAVHTNILLKGAKTGAYSVAMQFTPYLGWGSTRIRYDLFRWLKNSGQYELYASDITDFSAAFSNGLEYHTQCYRVRGTMTGSDTVTWSNDVCFNFEPVIYIPDAFSPNKDDYNDVFAVVGGALKTVEFSIFNRWGEKLFTGNSILDTWDGTYKGQDQPQDVYMFYCYYTGYDGRKYSTKGTITLLR